MRVLHKAFDIEGQPLKGNNFLLKLHDVSNDFFFFSNTMIHLLYGQGSQRHSIFDFQELTWSLRQEKIAP